MHLAVLDLEDSTGRPLSFLSARLDSIMLLSTMASLGGISKEHMAVFREDDVIANNVQVGNGRHDFGMGVGIVERSVADRECGWCREGGIGGAKMFNGGATLVVFRRVGCGHVFKDYTNVFLSQWISRDVLY